MTYFITFDLAKNPSYRKSRSSTKTTDGDFQHVVLILKCGSIYYTIIVIHTEENTTNKKMNISTTVTDVNGALVITQVIPQNAESPVSSNLLRMQQSLKAFLKGEPKALGYIISGSLSVAATKKPTPCLMKGALSMNIISAIFTILGICMYSLDIPFYYGLMECDGSNCVPALIQSVANGIKSLLLLFSILEFCIAFSLSIYGCTAACQIKDTILPVVIIQNPVNAAFQVPNIQAVTIPETQNPFVSSSCNSPNIN
ncbi:membrane-spanning 4-domains subfamily A member 18-like isoform X3 [Polypterus senegalus]|uniref:membrane-spanning 4-domains subfamily A member 18-like isoform X3 n=1 Tax=Polypterus senegalus TaxID=55291 RepID=UPI001966AAAE|nr:membrane-spanning 4-domains subfamily A member 18-like isoform X3 [Polypterus senegalus]